MSVALCGVCKHEAATFLCFCEEALVCGECIGKHLLENPSLSHKPVPLTSSELISIMRAEEKKQEVEVTDNSDSREELKQILFEELERLRGFKDFARSKLQEVEERWIEQLNQALEKVKGLLSKQVDGLIAEIEKGLHELDDLDPQPASNKDLYARVKTLTQGEQLLRLSLDLKPIDFHMIVMQAVIIEAEFRKTGKELPVIFKFFGGSNFVGVFDAKSESCLNLISSSYKFFHNACWTHMASGHILVTGGSLTGKSRNEVLQFSPSNGSVAEQHPMQIARRSHASLCTASNRCYVFGGIMDEERISMCERYNPDQNSWTSIANLHERRAYLGCCEFKDRVYIGGGSENSSMEVMDLKEEKFQLIQVSQVAVEDNCSLIPLADSLLIFHGNFRGDVSRLWPVTNKVVKEREMCYGNSWSNCAPVIEGDTVYMLRSDSVFKYNITTGASSYVIRLAKSAKHKDLE